MPSTFRAASLRGFFLAAALLSVGAVGLGTSATDAATIHSATRSEPATVTRAATATAAAGNTGSLLRIITWSGYRWLVYPAAQAGPEHTLLNNSTTAVSVDSHGRLHLRITKIDGKWRGAELECLNQVGYGTYHWILDTRTAKFARTTVLGMFVYRPGTQKLTNEIDVEDSKFSHLAAPNDAQFAVQPYYAPHHYHQYFIRASHAHLFQQFQWLPGKNGGAGTVHFVSRAGGSAHGPLISKWSYHGSSTPTPFNEHLFIDLWLNTNIPPKNGTHTAIIRSLHFSPAG